MRRLLLKLFRRRRLERDLAEEMAFHREMAASGGNPLPFGNQAVIAEQARDMWRFTVVENLWRDVVYGTRGLLRTPGFALTAIVTLSLGIAANVLVFAVADAALFKPLPYRDPDSLVYVQEVRGRDTPYQVRQVGTSWRQVQFFREQPQIFSEVVPFLGPQAAVVDPGTGSPWRIGGITPDLLVLLGIQPRLGRGFRPDEAGQDVVLLSHGFWQSAYAADRNVVGQGLTIDGRSHVVAGVMPATFKWEFGGDHVAGWRPLDEDAQPSFRGWIGATLRLRPGLTVEQATRELRVAVTSSPEAQSSGTPWDLELVPLDGRSRLLADRQRPLLTLLGAVGCLLFLGCANIANLLLARGISRRYELAVRAALGASRRRLFVQLLVEGTVLGVLAGAAAAAMTWWSVPVVPRLIPDGLPFFVANPLVLDARLLAFGCMTVAMTCVLSSVIAAFQGARGADHDVRRDGNRFGGAAGTGQLRFALQAGQIALAVVLVSGMFILAGSFLRITTTDVGYAREGLIAANLVLPETRYPDAASRERVFDDVLARVRKLQGVTVATYGMSPAEALTTRIVAEGRESESHATSIYVVNPNYFQVAGIALKAGRCFGPEDIQGAAPVVMIDANLAEFLWPGQQAIGRRLRSGPNAAWATVVGIVSPIKTGDFVTRARDFQMYRPVAQSAVSFRGMLARTDTDTDAGPIISAMRSTMTEVEASLDRVKPELVSDAYVDQLGSPRFYLALMTFLGIAGLTTAVVGIYASTNYAVRQRTREIGIRIALGSSRHRATLEMVRGTLRPSLAGTAAGMLLAFWLARQLSTLLYQVDPRDPRMFAGAGVLLIIATILGALVPAARAGQVDPATTLRAE